MEGERIRNVREKEKENGATPQDQMNQHYQ
jgi:hypothetical protein